MCVCELVMSEAQAELKPVMCDCASVLVSYPNEIM